jgi:hypothetical protein
VAEYLRVFCHIGFCCAPGTARSRLQALKQMDSLTLTTAQRLGFNVDPDISVHVRRRGNDLTLSASHLAWSETMLRI